MTDPTEQAILDLLEFIEDKVYHRDKQDIIIEKLPDGWRVTVPNWEFGMEAGAGKGTTLLGALGEALEERKCHIEFLKTWTAKRRKRMRASKTHLLKKHTQSRIDTDYAIEETCDD